MEYKIKVNSHSIYKAILTVINFSLKLSNNEIDIIATLLKYGFTVVNAEARDMLRKALDKDQYNINNYIKSLKTKKILLKEGKDIIINPNLSEVLKSKEIVFKFDKVN